MSIPNEIKPGSRSQRDFVLDRERAAIDTDSRTVEVAFSSETPVDRYWGNEILDHGKKSVRLDRMKQGGALLMDHSARDQIGVVESVKIGADKVGRAVVRFGKGARAEEMFQDVVDGIRRHISVGYRIHAAVLESSKDDTETYRITDWEPFEISLVSVPADVSVGVGRDDSDNGAPPNITTTTRHSTMSDENSQVREDNAANTSQAAIEAAATRAKAEGEQRGAQTGAERERKRVNEIMSIADQYGERYPAVRELAAKAVRGESGVDEFRADAMKAMASAPKETAEIGMTTSEKRKYSMVRALHYLANPRDNSARERAAFEIECSEAAAERAGKAPQGLLIPHDVLQRDLTVGTAADGGDTVATNLLAGSFIDLLRDKMVLSSLGMQMLTGLVGNIAIPRQTGAASAYWVDESGSPTVSKQAFDQVAMSPLTVGAYTDISRKLLLQSSIDIEAFVQNDLATVIALELQRVGIKGGGSKEPTGILATSSIGSVVGGTNGAAPDWADIIDLETAVSVANADVGTLAYLTNAKVRGKLKQTEKFSSSNGLPVWGEGANPLNGYRTGVTNAVPSNLTKGTATSKCSAILFGNFADLIMGMWGGLDITVDPYSNSTSGTVRVVALQDVDLAVRHAESFAAMQDALTA